MKKFTFYYFIKSFNGRLNSHKSVSEKEMNRSSSRVNSGQFSPSPETVQRILDFAHSYDVLETETAGLVEMNLN